MDSLPRRLRKLDEALAVLPLSWDVMTLSELDGFIAGLLVCPMPVEPEEWLELLWKEADPGEEAGEDAAGDGAAEAAALVPEILDHFKRTSLLLKAGEDAYLPILYSDSRTGEVLWEGWAAGFGEAMQVRMESWSAVAQTGDLDAVIALDGLKRLVTIANRPPPAGPADPERERLIEDAPDLIPGWVETLFDWRLGYRPEAVQTPVRSVKIGRNEPCPCGSGKKYKKCCGTAGP